MKKVLHIVEPIINTYTSYGALFSIIPQSAMPWVLNNFIQLNYVYNWNIATFDSHRMLICNCPAIDFYDVPKEILFSNRNFKDIIIEAIDRGDYLFFYVDWYYLSLTEMYKKGHLAHEIFVYGYDTEENLFYVADNFINGKFSFEKCDFNELAQSYLYNNSDYSFVKSIRFLRVHENEGCNLNINQIIFGLKSYLNSSEIFNLDGQLQMLYGMSIIDFYLKKISSLNEEIIDIRFFHLFYEHKLLMEMRVNYLQEKRVIIDNDKLGELANELKRDALILRNMVIKYNITKKRKNAIQVYEELIRIKEKDYTFCLQLLEELKSINY